jgi:hypothetical protein
LTAITDQIGGVVLTAGVSLAALVASLALLGGTVAVMPHDYFARAEPPPSRFAGHGRHVRITVKLIRNALAGVLLVAGAAMLVLPGQGVLTILVAVIVADFHRKRDAELWLVRHAHIFAALNYVRSAMRRAPLQPPGNLPVDRQPWLLRR